MWKDRRIATLVALAALAVVGVLVHGPIPQDPSYNVFADRRTLLGVPNFWDVVSNAPFLLVGVIGFLVALRRPTGVLSQLRAAYLTFFAAAFLVGLGSGWYHLRPTNASLAWDRLPMTIGFMAFLAIVLGEHLDPALGRRALAPLVSIGLASVALWWWSERANRSDLRLYVLVQYLPIVLIPLLVVLFPSRLDRIGLLWSVLGAYAAAKALELADEPVYRTLGISGHTLKHLAAAAGMASLVAAMRLRQPRELRANVSASP